MLICLIWVILSMPIGPEIEKNKDTLRLGTYNLHYLNPNAKKLPQLLAQNAVDVALLLEFTGENFDISLVTELGYQIILSAPKNSPYGMALLARNGLRVQAAAVPSPVSGPCPLPMIAGRCISDNQAISLLGLHAPPPVASCKSTTSRTLRAVSRYFEKGKLRQDVGKAKKGDDVIVFGDFNTLPFGNSLQSIRNSGCIDSYATTNWRPGPTWRPSTLNFIPSLARLDYVFVSQALHVIASHTVFLPGSDHRAVVADIAFKE